MLSNLFTSNFKKIAASTFLVLVTFLLLSQIIQFDMRNYESKNNIFIQEAQREQLLQDFLLKPKINNEIIILGDSTCVAVMNEFRNNSVFHLCDNIMFGMHANFFSLLRIIEKNKLPQKVVFMGINPIGSKLNHPALYTQKIFTNFSEIFDYFLTTKEYKTTIDMVLNKFFSLYKIRIQIQNRYEKLKNLKTIDIYDDRISNELNEYSNSNSEKYLIKILDLLKRSNTQFYYITSPIRESAFKIWIQKVQFPNYTPLTYLNDRLNYYEKTYTNFKVLQYANLTYSDNLFRDELHLTAEGSQKYIKEHFQNHIDYILSQ